jgi:hypothetical protein
MKKKTTKKATAKKPSTRTVKDLDPKAAVKGGVIDQPDWF